MFSRAKKFVQNHWKKVVVGGIAIQVAGIGLKYVTNRLMTYPEIQARELWKKVKKQQHFESIEKTCTSTYLCLLPVLKDTILQSLDAESLKIQLQNNPQNKLELWEELKVIAFSRVMATIYGTSILKVLLQIQINIVGGCLYQENESGKQPVVTNVDGVILTNDTAIDIELQNKYMAIADYFVHGGMEKLCKFIYERAQTAVSHLSLKQNLRVADLEQIFWAVVTSINRTNSGNERENQETCQNPVKYSWQYIFSNEMLTEFEFRDCSPEQIELNCESTNVYKKLVFDTYDLLNSDDVWGVLKSFESHGISYFIDHLAESVSQRPAANGDSYVNAIRDASGFNELVFPLARIIPAMNVSVSTGLNEIDPWVNLLVSSENLRILGANVYESFSAE